MIVGDITSALILLLQAEAGVSALAGSRVYGLELPRHEAAHMPRPLIVIEPTGGIMPPYTQSLRLDAARIDTYCFGETPMRAMELRRAVRLALRGVSRLRVGSTLLHWVRPAGGYASGRDPQTGWPRVWESWSVLAAEQAA